MRRRIACLFRSKFNVTLAAAIWLAAGQAFPEQVLRVGTYSLPRALGNPHASTSISEVYVWAALFDNLTEVDPEGNVVPSLAVSWRALNPLTWEFELRKGVRFSNGEPFDAHAVAATVNYIISDEAAGQSVAREFVSIEDVRVVDQYTVEISTSIPILVLPAKLAGLRMVAPQQWKTLGPEGFGREPVGTGPFKLVNWGTARADLVAVPDAWRPPKVDRLIFFALPDPSARLQGIQSGRLDIALVLSPDDRAALEKTGNRMHVSDSSAVLGMAFITVKDSPIKNTRVRQALNHAIDRNAINDVLLGGASAPANQPATRKTRGFNSELPPLEYDPSKAKRLLEEAGYPNGFDMVAEVVLNGTTAGPAIYSVVAQQLAAVGVNLEVRGIPIQQLISKSISGGFTGDAFGMSFDLKPTLDLMRGIPIHSCLRSVPWHCDPDVMPIIERAQREFDPDKRLALLHQIARIYHEDPPMLYFHEDVIFDGLAKRVRGYDPVHRIINYYDIRVSDGAN